MLRDKSEEHTVKCILHPATVLFLACRHFQNRYERCQSTLTGVSPHWDPLIYQSVRPAQSTTLSPGVRKCTISAESPLQQPVVKEIYASSTGKNRRDDIRLGIMSCHACLDKFHTREPIALSQLRKLVGQGRDRDTIYMRSSSSRAQHERAAQETHKMILLGIKPPTPIVLIRIRRVIRVY